MSLALCIRPFSDILDMYGDADSSSVFSLSGHVSLALASPSSLFVRRRRPTRRVLLQSLTVTFDGQSEVLSPATGYAPIRLCSITRELLSGDPVDLCNDGHEDADKPCLWNVVFDIPVPGWLPTTSVYGDASLQATGTSYALYATATFVDTTNGCSSFSFANICGLVRSRTRTVDAHRCPIIIRRFVEPQPGSSSTLQMSVYSVDARRTPESEDSSRGSIPSDILEKIQVVASIPSATAMNETCLPFILRIRGKDLDDTERKNLRITEFFVDVEQVEVYRKNLSRDEANEYPIPPQIHQPPRIPLRNPHPIHTLYDTGFLGTFGSNIKRSFSILAPTESGRYIISGDGRIFALELGHNVSPEDGWYTLETVIPIFKEPCVHDWAGARKRRVTERSPLFRVEHYVHIVICCEYSNLADPGDPILERLHFSLPMKHVNVPGVPTSLGNAHTENQSEDMQKDLPYTQTLPAYSQLFHSNGERKHDYTTPLPLYRPPSASSSSRLAPD